MNVVLNYKPTATFSVIERFKLSGSINEGVQYWVVYL